MRSPKATSCVVTAVIVICCLSFAGCGTNIDQVFSQTAGATGRTFFDLLLTDFLNAVADAMDQTATAQDGTADGGGTDGGGTDGGGTDGGGTDGGGTDGGGTDGGGTDGGGTDGGGTDGGGTGDVAAGEAFYADNGCGACHGADGSGGFAPTLVGVDAATMLDKLDGSQTHAGGTVDGATSQDADALVAYLDSLQGGGSDTGGGATGDPVAGEAVFASNGCGTCHCDDASGGCALAAPSLVGVGPDTLDGKMSGSVGHVGGTFDLTDTEMADLAAYLGSL